MAEKGFGIKEINLIGASGTPTITSPNNINLNAANVAISTNISIGGNLDVDSHTNLDNVSIAGITTASDHVVVGSGLSVVGISTLGDIVKIMSGLELQTNGTLDLLTSSSSSGLDIQSSSSVQIGQKGSPNNDYATFTNTGVNLYYNGSSKLTTTNTGINVTGAITVNGSATSAWTVGHNSSSNYVISGPGGLSSANNPDLYLERGQTYQFIMNASGHGFGIQTSPGTWNSSNAYTTGITNAGAATGIITFAVPYSAPARLYYACTSQHSGMVGNIYLRGASAGSAGITMYDTYHLTSNASIDSNVSYMDSNFSRVTGTGFGRIDLNGSGMTKSGQHFSFPATGLYEIRFLGIAFSNNTSRYVNYGIQFNTAGTADSDYLGGAQITSAIPEDNALAYGSGSAVFLFDVTNTSTHHVRFWTNVESGSTSLQGTALSNGIRTSAIFKRIGDT